MPDHATDAAAAAEAETRLLAAADQNPWPAQAALADLDLLFEAAGAGKAMAAAELSAEALLGRGEEEGLTAVLEWMARRCVADAEERCVQMLKAMYGARRDAAALAMLESAGFQKCEALEALRRLRVLRRLKPGAYCCDKTWDFGVVSEVDAFYRRVTVDFSHKKRHAMSMAYAAEALEIVTAAHFLAQKHLQPEKIRLLCAQAPADAVTLALESMGPLTVSQLQSLFSGGILAAEEWKAFWEAARKALKNNSRIRLPVRKNEPLMLLAAHEPAGDGGDMAELAREHEPAKIIRKIEQVIRGKDGRLAAAQNMDFIRERLGFALRGAAVEGVEWTARGVVAWRELGFGAAAEFAAACAALRQPELLKKAADRLPAGTFAALLAALAGEGASETLKTAKEILPALAPDAVSAVMTFFGEHLAEREKIEFLRAAFLTSGRSRGGLLAWLAANIGYAAEKGIAAPAEILNDCLQLLGDSLASGARLKAKNAVKACFDRAEWRNRAFGMLDELGRREAARRLKNCSAWPAVDYRVLVAEIIENFPELKPEFDDSAEVEALPRRITSCRRYRERQEQLRRLISVEIPKNSRDIATARSYGDLSENFEYKAAKEHQALLMKQCSELEKMLLEVKPSDFVGLPLPDRACIGSEVRLRKPDGSVECVRILGEWDSDERLRIVSCSSELARALLGRRAGETAALPGESGLEPCVIESVGPLPPEVRAWASGAAGAPENPA